MCGIFGFFGEHQPNMSIIKTLGVLNELERGGNGYGFFWKNNVYKSMSTIGSDFDRAFVNHRIAHKDVNDNLFLGHARKASMLLNIDLKSCHPHQYTKDGVTTTAVHNGTISNYKELAINYINNNDLFSDSQILTIRLLEDRDKNFKVLHDYEGSATIVWTYSDEPDYLYVYKGDAMNTIDTRPLNFLNLENGFYFSSDQKHLEYVFGTEVKILTIKPGFVYKINKKFESTAVKQIGPKYKKVQYAYANDADDFYNNKQSPKNKVKGKTVPHILDKMIITVKGNHSGRNFYFENLFLYDNGGVLLTGIYKFIPDENRLEKVNVTNYNQMANIINTLYKQDGRPTKKDINIDDLLDYNYFSIMEGMFITSFAPIYSKKTHGSDHLKAPYFLNDSMIIDKNQRLLRTNKNSLAHGSYRIPILDIIITVHQGNVTSVTGLDSKKHLNYETFAKSNDNDTDTFDDYLQKLNVAMSLVL